MLERLLTSTALALSLGCAAVSATSPGQRTSPTTPTKKTISAVTMNLEEILPQLEKIHADYPYAIPTAAKKHGLDEELIVAVIRYESSGNSEAISWTGCTGLMQICAGSANGSIKYMCRQEQDLGPQECCSHKRKEKPGGPGPDGPFWYDPCIKRKKVSCVIDDRFYPWKNVDSGTAILKGKIGQYKGYSDQLRLGLAAYNAGEGVINEAIKATGEKDPFWTTVYLNITSQTFRKFKTYENFTEQQLQRKIESLFGYVVRIEMAYKEYKRKRQAKGKLPDANT